MVQLHPTHVFLYQVRPDTSQHCNVRPIHNALHNADIMLMIPGCDADVQLLCLGRCNLTKLALARTTVLHWQSLQCFQDVFCSWHEYREAVVSGAELCWDHADSHC